MADTLPGTLVTRLDGPAVEREIARDLAKKAIWIAPAMIVLGFAFWGGDGACSAGYALGIVTLNLVLSASLLAWAARISLALLMGVALFGFLIRLAFIFLAVMLVKDAAWIDVVPLGLGLVVTHLGLLFWETRYVSASMAFPGLKPKKESLA